MAQSFCGSVPAVTGAQMPSATPVLAAMQAWQRPVHAVEQQTLSMQEKAHSPDDVQALPGDK